MGDHEHGDAPVAVEAADQFHDLHAGARVQVAGGLVGEQHRGFGDDRPGDGHPLLLAAGEFARGVFLPAGKPHLGKGRARRGVTLGGRCAPVDERQFDVFERARARQQVESLEDKAQAVAPQQRPLLAVELFDRKSLEPVTAAGGRVQAAKDVHGRGFARTARPHDGHELARVDDQVNS